MKQGLHPAYYRATVTCACGETFETGSTTENLRTEICSKCHPFYTGGKQRNVQAGGRIERFRRKFGQA